MRAVYHLIIKELKQLSRDKRMRFMVIVAPVIQLVLLGYAATTDVRSIPIAIYDADRTSESRSLINGFTNSGYFEISAWLDSDKKTDEQLERGKAWIALVIPRKFSADVLARRTARLQLIADGTDANSVNIALGYSTLIINNYSRALAEKLLETSPVKPGGITPQYRVLYNESLKSRNFMIPAVVVLVLMIVTLTITAMAIVKEKEIGTLEQLLVAPIKPYQLILGKLLPFVLVGMVDVTLVMLVAIYWFEVPPRGNIGLIYVMALAFILTTLGIGLFVSTIANTRQQALMIGQFGFFIPFMYFSGFVFPIANMPQAIQYVTLAVPLRYMLEAVRAIFLKGTGLDVLWPDAVALLAIGALVLSLSILRFRRKLG
ncbi:MAG: ABC transporter permease [Nitrospinae bacterium]|nr:ABC transporter permease [Nitrospinota bacterium]